MAKNVSCPFCGFQDEYEYHIQLHIEEHHTEDSPFVVTNSKPDLPPRPDISRQSSSGNSTDSDNPWIHCTRPGCGEYVHISALDEHYDFHQLETRSDHREPETRESSNSGKRPASADGPSTDVTRSPRKVKRPRDAASSTTSRRRSFFDYFTGSSFVVSRQPSGARTIKEPQEPGRLGKRELGPHAYEKRMPDDVRRTLINNAEPRYENRIGHDGRIYREGSIENETRGLVPVLADLCALDKTTTATYFCDPSVRHVVKIRCDGNFCGFWNIQMLLSYLNARLANGKPQPRRLPNVLEIQDTIEQAWDNGICPYGRIETGGIRNTRKWIGGSEAAAYFTQVGVPVEALAFTEDETDSSSPPAVVAMLDHIEAYFMSALDSARQHGTSHITSMPPIYFQRFGHSMTIVGLERKKDGSRNVILFDPSFATSAGMGRLLARRKAFTHPNTLLQAYRRSEVNLSRWDEFEIIVPRLPGKG
jgi:zinc finger-containing ubiquitin peptidase 1